MNSQRCSYKLFWKALQNSQGITIDKVSCWVKLLPSQLETLLKRLHHKYFLLSFARTFSRDVARTPLAVNFCYKALHLWYLRSSRQEVGFFFYLGFLSQTFTNHRTAGEGRGHFFNSSVPLPTASQTLRH